MTVNPVTAFLNKQLHKYLWGAELKSLQKQEPGNFNSPLFVAITVMVVI